MVTPPTLSQPSVVCFCHLLIVLVFIVEEEAGIDGWNAVDDEYAFIYLTPDGKDKVLVKCLTIGDKLAVNALKHGADQPVHLVVK